MGQYGAPTPKPTLLWSSTPTIFGFWSGKFKMSLFKAKTSKVAGPKPVIRYKDKEGRTKWQGTRDLTKTATLEVQIVQQPFNCCSCYTKKPKSPKVLTPLESV